MTEQLKLGLPKGSLQEATLDLLAKAGWRVRANERSYRPSIDDPCLDPFLIRAQEMSIYVEQGIFDCGITGYDWVLENDSTVESVTELVYSKAFYRPVRWVLAVPDDSPIKRPEDLQGKRISTEVVNLTRRWLAERQIDAQIEFSWGATEVKPGLLTDAIVEVTETGNSLRANKLRIVDTIMESTTRFIANADALIVPWKRDRINNLARMLTAAIDATGRVGLKMNIQSENLEGLLAVLPSMKAPTISQLVNGSGAAVEVVIEERQVRDLIPQVVAVGATDIIEYPLNKVIP